MGRHGGEAYSTETQLYNSDIINAGTMTQSPWAPRTEHCAHFTDERFSMMPVIQLFARLDQIISILKSSSGDDP